MADRPIIFSAPMVLALLEGRKTQTRRLVRDMPAPPAHDSLKQEPKHEAVYFDSYCSGRKTPENPRGMSVDWCWWTRDDRAGQGCRIGFVPGDRLYVREAWHVRGEYSDVVEVGYAASRNRSYTEYAEQIPVALAIPGKGKWPRFPNSGPSIHMPRWASRLTLIVEDVRVERLQSISHGDALAEGLGIGDLDGLDPIGWYCDLWGSLHGAESWDANPFVVAVTFRVEHGNIDRIGASA